MTEITEEYLDYLTRDPAHLVPWIREIYPLMWAALHGPDGERQRFAFDLLQPLHQ